VGVIQFDQSIDDRVAMTCRARRAKTTNSLEAEQFAKLDDVCRLLQELVEMLGVELYAHFERDRGRDLVRVGPTRAGVAEHPASSVTPDKQTSRPTDETIVAIGEKLLQVVVFRPKRVDSHTNTDG
jgi:hypothetical protein